jgi:hypothetical protein
MSTRETKPTPQARAGAHVGKPKTRRARQRREGVVIMIVMLMIVMATGSAMFAIQSTQYEQRAAAAIGEANWARSVSECTTMAALAYVEDPQSGGEPKDLSVEWKPGSTSRAKFSIKYAFPPPLRQNVGDSGDIARSASFDTELSVGSAAGGKLAVFLPDQRRRDSTLPSFSDRDDQTGATPGLRLVRAHWLQERLSPTSGTSTNGTRSSTGRTRTVVTGFGEVHVANDPFDSDNVRELHELDAISRGYIDKVE